MMQAHRNHRQKREGMTVLLVLGMLAITIALSYAMLRSQVTSAQIQENLNAGDNAEQAAQTGLMVAIRRMHQSTWPGVGTQFGGLVEAGVFYIVKYEVGDAQLTATDADYDKYPYRVTITSTGYVVDSVNSLVASQHVTSAVVELIPRALSSQPANWTSLQNHTVHQWKNADVICQTPVHIAGPAALQGPVKLCEDYPPSSRPWDGKIDEVAIYDTALSQSNLAGIATSAIFGKGLLSYKINSYNPTHYWQLDESSGATVAVDSAGGENGTYENGTTTGTSGYLLGNKCAEFDGRNDHINVGNFNMTGDKLTMLAYFKADDWGDQPYARIVSKATGTSNSDHYWMLSVAPSGSNMRIRSRIRTSGVTTALVASSGNLSLNTWYQAAAVYDGTDMILYLNGVEVGRTAKTGNLDGNSDVPVFIGESPPGSPQTRLLRDLEAMRAAGQPDWRPFAGPIDMPRANTDASTQLMMTDDLNLTTNDVAVSNSAPVSHPGRVSTYRLYTGGPTYTVQAVPSGDRTEDLSADPATNPLGLFSVEGALNLQAGVNVNGTIITSGTTPDLKIEGNNVTLSPHSLPALYGTTTPIELPAAMVTDDVVIEDVTGATINGVVYAGDKFTLQPGRQTAECTLSGRLFAGELQLNGRTEWANVSSGQWESGLTQFVNQLSDSNPETYYPHWLQANRSLESEPLLTIRPQSSAVTYHWQDDWSQPVFVPHAADAGLLWQIIRMD